MDKLALITVLVLCMAAFIAFLQWTSGSSGSRSFAPEPGYDIPMPEQMTAPPDGRQDGKGLRNMKCPFLKCTSYEYKDAPGGKGTGAPDLLSAAETFGDCRTDCMAYISDPGMGGSPCRLMAYDDIDDFFCRLRRAEVWQ